MKNSSVSEWHKWFKEGQSSRPRSHRTDENVEKFAGIWCIQMFKNQSYGCATKILTKKQFYV